MVDWYGDSGYSCDNQNHPHPPDKEKWCVPCKARALLKSDSLDDSEHLRVQVERQKKAIEMVRAWTQDGLIIDSHKTMAKESLIELCRKTEGPCFCGCHITRIE